jgi:hypothetical protein
MFGGDNPFEIIAKAANEGRFGDLFKNADTLVRQGMMTPEARREFEVLTKLLAQQNVQLRNGGSVGVTVHGRRRPSSSFPVRARLLFKRHQRRGNCTCTVAGRGVFAATWGGAHLRAACKLVSAGSVIYSPLLRRCYATTGNGRYNCPAPYESPPGEC